MKPPSTKTHRDDMISSGVITTGSVSASGPAVRMVPDQVTYFFQQQQQQQQAQTAAATIQPQIIQLQVRYIWILLNHFSIVHLCQFVESLISLNGYNILKVFDRYS